MRPVVVRWSGWRGCDRLGEGGSRATGFHEQIPRREKMKPTFALAQATRMAAGSWIVAPSEER